MPRKRIEKITTKSSGTKKIPKLKRGDIVVIYWHDAFSNSGGTWMSKEEVNAFVGGPIKVFTVAMYWSTKVEQINLIQTVVSADGSVANPFSIPVGCIKKVCKIGRLELDSVYSD